MDDKPSRPSERRFQPYHPPSMERRMKPDWMVRSIQWFVMAAWLMVLIIMLNVVFSAPSGSDFFTRMSGYQTGWNLMWLHIAQYLSIGNVGVCLFGLIFNALRLKRKEDHVHMGLVIAGVVSVAGMIALQIMMANVP